RTGHRAMADVLDACALAIASGSLHVEPGAVVPNAVGLVDPERRCEHLILAPPFLWPGLQVVDETGGPDGTGPLLTRLQAAPITTAAMSAAARDGADALFGDLDPSNADGTNPDSPSPAGRRRQTRARRRGHAPAPHVGPPDSRRGHRHGRLQSGAGRARAGRRAGPPPGRGRQRRPCGFGCG